MRLTDLHWIDAFAAREQAIEAIIRTIKPTVSDRGAVAVAALASAAPSVVAPTAAAPSIDKMDFNTEGWDERARKTLDDARRGQAAAQVDIADLFQRGGHGVPKDYKIAVAWLLKAAKQGNAFGQYYLGRMYEEGYGVRQDDSEALNWYRKAAEQGETFGQYHLERNEARLNRRGIPVGAQI